MLSLVRHLAVGCLGVVLVSGATNAQQTLSPMERAIKQRDAEQGNAAALTRAAIRAEAAAKAATRAARAAENAAKLAHAAAKAARTAAKEANKAKSPRRASNKPGIPRSNRSKRRANPARRFVPSPGGSGEEQLRAIAKARGGVTEHVILERDFSTTPRNCTQCGEGVFLNGNRSSNGPLPRIDGGWLKFTVRSKSGAAAGGGYFVKFPKQEIKPGESLYVRWQQRFDKAFFRASRAGGGFKVAIIGDAQQHSCSSNEIVFNNLYNRGIVQGYHACGRSQGFETRNHPRRRSDWNYQPGGDNACWRTTKPYPETPRGCFRFVPDEVFTFEVRIDVAAETKTKSRIRLWLTRESRARELVIDYRRVLVDSTKGYGAVWLLPYNTGKRSSVAHPEAHTWYDNLWVAKVSGEPARQKSETAAPPATDGGKSRVETALGGIAASMAAGEWREIATRNINQTLGAKGSSGTVFGYTDNLKWDPMSRQLFYAGGDHGDSAWFLAYSAETNSWRRIGKLPKWSHGYDHSAIDPAGRSFFYRPYNTAVIRRYDITSGNWNKLPSFKSKIRDLSCCSGVEYFPELRALVYVSISGGKKGSVLLWSPKSNKWRKIASGLPMGTYHNFAAYNPVHRAVLFGGGNGPNGKRIYSLDREGKVRRLGNAPVQLGIERAAVTVDPVGGDYLIFTKKRLLYAYNVISDTWRRIKSPVPIWTQSYNNPIHGLVATSIAAYGINFFATCKRPRRCSVYLYRHTKI